MNPKILAALFAGAAVSAASANTLIWSDNFNVADNASFDDAPLDGRLSGTLATATRLHASGIQQRILGNQLQMQGGRVRFQKMGSVDWYNWAGGAEAANILADGGIRVEFDFTATDLTSGNWVACVIGHGNRAAGEPAGRVTDGATDFGILFRNDGRTERFDNGTNLGAGASTTPVATPRHIVLDYAFAAYADGTPVKIRASVDGVLVSSNTFYWDSNAGELYMELESNQSGTLIDNFKVSTVPVIYLTTLSKTSFISGLAPSGLIATLSGATFAKGSEASTFAFADGEGDTDNAKFVINGDRLETGSYDFKQDPEATQYFVRVLGTSTVSSGTQEKSFVLTLIKDDDADGINDVWEIEFAGDITTLDGTGNHDFDGDGLTDLQEYNLRNTHPGLSPVLADSDGDGLTDYQELHPVAPRLFTNPVFADTDKDGLLDGVESNTGTFVNAADTGTNPLKPDTDLDGARDGFEVERGSVPTNISSRPTLPANFAVVQITDDASSGVSDTKLYSHAVSGGAAATVNGVNFGELTGSSAPPNFTWTGTNKLSQVNNGIYWVPASGGVTDPGLQGLLGSFTYANAQNPGDMQTFTLSGLSVGTRYEFRLYIRAWSDATLRPIDLVFVNGESVEQPYGALLEDRPGTILNNNNDYSAYYLSYTYVAEATSLVVEAKIHPSSPLNSGSLHFYGLSNESPAQLVISLTPTSFISGISAGGTVGTLESETLTMETEPTTYVFAAGDDDDDNWKFNISGDKLLAGSSYDFKQDPEGTQYFIRVQGTGANSAFTQQKAFVLTLIKDDDADGLNDAWELEIAGDLTTLNGTGNHDFDGDGLTDLQEYNLRTTYPGLSPLIADSDDDGLTDGEELNPVAPRPITNPILADTDKDGLLDGVESNSGTFVNAADTGTNPLVADTDLDGARDGFEVERSSVPTDFASRPALPAGFSVVALTDDASTGISAAKTYTHAISGGGPATINGVLLEELNPGLIPLNFDWTTSVGTRQEVNPINNGAWLPADGGVTGPGLLNLLGGFAYGSSGEPAAFQTYTLSGLTPGETYHLQMYYRPWAVADPSFRPIDLTFTNGASVEQPFGALPIDRPGIVLDNDNINSAFALGYTYVAETTELVIQALVHESARVASGSNHLYGLTNETETDYGNWAASFGAAFTDPAPDADPDGDGLTNQQEYAFGLNPTKGTSVNPISVPFNGSEFAYTRRAGSGLSYKVLYSTNLTDWAVDQNAVQTAAAAVAGVETVTVTLVDAVDVDGKLFIRIQAGD